jgi:hypothetical protein
VPSVAARTGSPIVTQSTVRMMRSIFSSARDLTADPERGEL